MTTAQSKISGLNQSIQDILRKHPEKSGAYVLERGEGALLARAWLSDQAQTSIDIQYFIWRSDNIGILASESLLRAADRGVRVRVLIDDFGAFFSAHNILSIAAHPLIDIRIYNPKVRTGVSPWKRFHNVLRDFHALNQRMHDKLFVVDSCVAITGGRNMADEYYDFDRVYSYRDRDILVLGPAIEGMNRSFDEFWASPLSIPVEMILKRTATKLTQPQIEKTIQAVHAYAENPANCSDEVREILNNLPRKFSDILDSIAWDNVRFVHDEPGRIQQDLTEEGETRQSLIEVVKKATSRVVIQSPYFVMPDGGLDLFKQLIAKGVKVSIITNSLAASDNPFAFSGYKQQRQEILNAGLDVYEYRPKPADQRDLDQRYSAVESRPPVFALHAKTMVIDGKTLFVGSFNLDPRSSYLNTEVGILISNPKIAGPVEQEILTDMLPENSWNARTDNPDAHVPATKRLLVRLVGLLPLKPLL
jgi:putative cardiolipin synthase